MGKEIGRFYEDNQFGIIHYNTEETGFIIFSFSYIIFK